MTSLEDPRHYFMYTIVSRANAMPYKTCSYTKQSKCTSIKNYMTVGTLAMFAGRCGAGTSVTDLDIDRPADLR